MFSKFSQCIKSCFDESSSYGVTSSAGRRPSVEGAPPEDNGIPESTLAMFRARHSYVDLPYYSDGTNGVPKRDCQQDGSSHRASGIPSKTTDIPDDVLRMCWARHRYLALPRRPSRVHVHFSTDIPKPGVYNLNVSSHSTSAVPMAPSKATSSCTKEYSSDSAYISEVESTDKEAAEHDDADSGLKVQESIEETMQSEGVTDMHNEETIGSKFEAVHIGKSVLKIVARKREPQVEHPEVRTTTTDIAPSEHKQEEVMLNQGAHENM